MTFNFSPPNNKIVVNMIMNSIQPPVVWVVSCLNRSWLIINIQYQKIYNCHTFTHILSVFQCMMITKKWSWSHSFMQRKLSWTETANRERTKILSTIFAHQCMVLWWQQLPLNSIQLTPTIMSNSNTDMNAPVLVPFHILALPHKRLVKILDMVAQ